MFIIITWVFEGGCCCNWVRSFTISFSFFTTSPVLSLNRGIGGSVIYWPDVDCVTNGITFWKFGVLPLFCACTFVRDGWIDCACVTVSFWKLGCSVGWLCDEIGGVKIVAEFAWVTHCWRGCWTNDGCTWGCILDAGAVYIIDTGIFTWFTDCCSCWSEGSIFTVAELVVEVLIEVAGWRSKFDEYDSKDVDIGCIRDPVIDGTLLSWTLRTVLDGGKFGEFRDCSTSTGWLEDTAFIIVELVIEVIWLLKAPVGWRLTFDRHGAGIGCIRHSVFELMLDFWISSELIPSIGQWSKTWKV